MYLKTLTGSGLSPAFAVSIPGGLASERIVNAPAEPQNWLTYWGDLQDRTYKGENRKLILHAGRNGVFYVLDPTDGKLLSATPYVRTSGVARTGKPLWHLQAGNEIPSSPMSYAVDGKQYVVVSSAGVLFSFALPD